jgi:hypothetical protein
LPGRPWFAPLVVIAFAASCRHSTGSAPPGSCPGGQDEALFGAIVVHKADARPAWVLVPRDGDPRGAVAAVVITGGASYASTVLSALVEARLEKSGFSSVEARADRDSFRMRTLVETPERAVEFARSLQKALSTPVSAGAPELGLVSRRVVSLKRRPFEAPIVASIARCTGELGIVASEAAPDPAYPEGLAALERARVAAYGSQRVAFAVVGPSPLTDGAAEGWASGEKWPDGASIDMDGSSDDEVGVFASGRPAGPPRVTLALTQRRADAAVEAASQAGGAEGALVARLRALSVPFRVVEAVGTARPQGGCVGLTLEALRPPASGLEEAAALAATIARQEIEARARSVTEDAGRERGLGYHGSRAVRTSSDPREAAELAALWSLTTTAPSDERERAVVALSFTPAAIDPREGSREGAGAGHDALAALLQASTKRLSSALDRVEKAWTQPVLERRDRVERGQGELWLLAASPCGVLSEGEMDAGTTALSLMTALASRSRESRGVVLEPWITPDGVGVMAHAARLPGESTSDQTARVAEEAARAISVFPFSASAFASARAALLGRIGDGISPDGKAMNALAAALVPGHPSWLAPLGAWEGLAKAGVEGASLRWSALTAGPLRLAVLANESQEQADGASRVLDRWLVRTSSQLGPRACSPVEAFPSPKAGTLSLAIASAPPLAQALVGIGVPRQGTPEAVWGELTLAGLGGTDGWLAKAVASPAFAATAQGRLVGGARGAALVVDIRAPEASLDAVVAQVRGLLERLRQGAMGPSDFERSTAQRERWDLEASLDPRRRLVDLWREPRPPKAAFAPSLDGWRAWAAGALRDDKLVVVLAKPRH